jgi:hypothetical protein
VSGSCLLCACAFIFCGAFRPTRLRGRIVTDDRTSQLRLCDGVWDGSRRCSSCSQAPASGQDEQACATEARVTGGERGSPCAHCATEVRSNRAVCVGERPAMPYGNACSAMWTAAGSGRSYQRCNAFTLRGTTISQDVAREHPGYGRRWHGEHAR